MLGASLPNVTEVFAENFDGGAVFSQGDITQTLLAWADRFLMAFLIVLSALLLINIVVKFRVQHASVLVNGLLLIVVIAGALYVNVHRVEAIGDQVKILAAILF